MTHLRARALRRSRSVSCPYKIPPARQPCLWVPTCLVSFASLFTWRCLAGSFPLLHVAVNTSQSSMVVSINMSASDSNAYSQSSAMSNERTSSLCIKATHYFPSRFPNTVHFSNCPQKNSRIRKIVSMRLHPVIYVEGAIVGIEPMVWYFALSLDDAKKDPVVYAVRGAYVLCPIQ